MNYRSYLTIAFIWMIVYTPAYSMIVENQPIVLTLDMLLSDSLSVLKNSYQTKQEFLHVLSQSLSGKDGKQKENRQEILNTIYHTAQHFDALNPLFFVNECPFDPKDKALYPSHKHSCNFSREKNPQFRGIFEDCMSSALIKKIRSKRGHVVNYVGFGSGWAFSDLMIISKALEKEPYAMLNIFLTDPIYMCYNVIKRLLHSPFDQLNVDDLEALNLQNTKIGEFIKSKDFSDSARLFVTTQMFYIQFLRWLHGNFPYATFQIMSAPFAQYITDVGSEKLRPADFIVASDITTEQDTNQDSMKDFVILCLYTLRKDPSARNYLLAILKGKPLLLTVSLSRLNDQSAPFGEGNFSGYISYQDLLSLSGNSFL